MGGPPSINLYDELDPLYRRIWGTSLHHGHWKRKNESPRQARENLIQLLISLVRPQGVVADIGCGYGVLARRLVQDFKCEVIACTPSRAQASLIKPMPGLTILEGDWLEQELPRSSIDLALAIESVSHFPSFEHFFRRTCEALKPGSQLLIADWFSETGDHPLLRHLASTGGIPPWRSFPALLGAAKAHGLHPVRCLDLSGSVAPTWHHLFRQTLFSTLRTPDLILPLISRGLKNPALLWSFPLLRLAYATGDLEYHVTCLQK